MKLGTHAALLRSCLAGLLLTGLAPAGVAHAAEQPVMFQSTDTPPFWSPALPEHGLGGAILRLLSQQAGVTYGIDYLPVKRFRNSSAPFIVGDPDILLKPGSRAILPIAVFQSAFFYYRPRQRVAPLPSLGQLEGRTLGVLRGTVEDAEYFAGLGIRIEESDSVESLLHKLRRGRIDACILVDATGSYTVNKLFPEEAEHFVQVPIPGSERPIALLIDVQDPHGRAVAARYREILKATLRSRRYRDIVQHYYGSGPLLRERMAQLDRFVRVYATEWQP